MTAEKGADAGWLRRYHPGPQGGPRLVCLPHAGGSATSYRALSQLLSPSVDVVSVQYPGRHDRRSEAGVAHLPTLADQVFTVLSQRPDPPVALFGHSMGAIVAYEVALRMEAAGHGPLRVVASGRRAPSRYRDERVHTRDDCGVLRELLLLDGTHQALVSDPEIIEMIMPALRADYRAIETYRHEPGRMLRCPLTVLVGDDDPRTSRDEAEAWARHTSGPVDVHVFPGGHFYLNAQLAGVAEVLTKALTRDAATSSRALGTGPA